MNRLSEGGDGEVADWDLSERHFSGDDIKLTLSLVFGLVGWRILDRERFIDFGRSSHVNPGF
jgi:hypothetical protein